MNLRSYDDDLVPLCERCWIDENSLWEADSVDIQGNIITRLLSVTVPIHLSPGAVNECYICNKITVVGIYTSVDNIDGDEIDLDQDMEVDIEEPIEPDDAA